MKAYSQTITKKEFLAVNSIGLRQGVGRWEPKDHGNGQVQQRQELHSHCPPPRF
jgi:hypothetical protein